MRDYKFRAWDIKQSKMVYDHDLYIMPDSHDRELNKVTGFCIVTNHGILFWIHETQLPHATNEHFDHAVIYNKDIILLEFTGLKDKNGKEIYEGDVISYQHPDLKEEHRGFIACEEWLEFYVEQIGEWECDDLVRDFYRIEKFEVIGNIHENSDLMESS